MEGLGGAFAADQCVSLAAARERDMQNSRIRRPNYGHGYPEGDHAPHDLDAEHNLSSQRSDRVPEQTEFYSESPPMAPPRYASRIRYRQFANREKSIGKRMFRPIARFLAAVLIGVGVTLAWQSYGDQAKLMVATWAPSLDWLVPQTTGSPKLTPAMVPDLVLQLKPLSLDLAIVRRNLEQLVANQEQLAARQQQMAQSISAMQQLELEIRDAVYASRKSPLPVGH